LKKLFPGHYRPSDDEFRSLWTNGLFVFDTNVLLNFYSYPEKARDTFFSVLKRVVDRSWIPYQVALEFHNNRFTRLRKSNEQLLSLHDRIQANSSELESEFARIEFDKRNTGIEDLHERLAAVREANRKLAEAVDLACKRLPNVSLDDPIGARIAELLDGKVGDPPADQEALDALIKDGDERYESKIPPGFKDAKDKRDLKYRDRELTYMAKFGDLILWRQTIAYVSKQGKKDVIFITGDRKEDWWSSHEGKTLGPAPELVQEFLTKSGAERFWMYSADQFLANAEQYLKAKEVTEETIAQVRETADSQQSEALVQNSAWEDAKFGQLTFNLSDHADAYRSFIESERETPTWRMGLESAVTVWAKHFHRSDMAVRTRHLDFAILKRGGGVHGYEIVAPRGLRRRAVHNAIKALSFKRKELAIEAVSIVVVLSEDEFHAISDDALESFASDIVEMMAENPVYSVVIGYLDENEFVNVLTIEGPKG
jgi:hypothetical protein